MNFIKETKSKSYSGIKKKEPVPLEYGVVVIDNNNRIVRFLEKPSWGEVFSNTINTGIYILEPEVMNYFQKGEKFDFSKDLFPNLLEQNIPMYGYVTESYWCDIGALSSYKETQFDMLTKKVNLNFKANEIKENIWIEDGALVSKKAELKPPLYIGRNSVIGDNVEVGPFSVIGSNCKIGANSSLKNTTIWENVTMDKLCETRGSVLCNNVSVGSKVKVFENSVIGEGNILKDNVTVKPDVKVWPQKKVQPDTVLTQNLIWGTQAKKNVFGKRSIVGDVNTDITPEFATKIGSTYASTFEKDGSIVVSGDETKSTCLIRNALIAGIQSTGMRVINVNRSLLPMTRFAIKHFEALGGIHVKGSHDNPSLVNLEFLNEKGANIPKNSERKIENLLCTEGIKRCTRYRNKGSYTSR